MSPRDVMEVTTLCSKLELRSDSVHRYGDENSVHYGCLLFDLSPRTDHRLHYFASSESIPSKLHIPERLKHFYSLNVENTNSFYSPFVSTDSCRYEKRFLQLCQSKLLIFIVDAS